MKTIKLTIAFAVLLALATTVWGSYKFEGYSLSIEADDTGVCPLSYFGSSSNSVEVYIAGTNKTQTATNLTACGGSVLDGTYKVKHDGTYGTWCFTGPEELYEVKFTNGKSYLWLPTTEKTGFYNVKDFRPVTYNSSSFPHYTYTEPADYTQTIKNAVIYAATKQGGTLYFPQGDYIIGTTDGSTKDSNYKAITLPSGIIIQGASHGRSNSESTYPFDKSTSRIKLKHENQTIFRIGSCTNDISIRNIELIGSLESNGTTKIGNYGIEGFGKYISNENSSSQVFKFENITFQNLDTGIYVHNTPQTGCGNTCHAWQFDHVKVDHGTFVNNRRAIRIDTYNTDWKITNSIMNYAQGNSPGIGIDIEKAGAVLVEQTWGGGYSEDNASPLSGDTFIKVITLGSLTVVNSGAERGIKDIYINENAPSSMVVTVINSVFGNKVELNGNLNYISTGNLYGAKTVVADPGVKITSTGDRFCYTTLLAPNHCLDENQNHVNNPGFQGGKIIFQTGRLTEGSGSDEIAGRPTFFGYDVEVAEDDASTTNLEPLLNLRSANLNKPILRLGQSGFYYDFARNGSNGFLTITGNYSSPYTGFSINGPLQFDSSKTYTEINTYNSLISDGVIVYCKDCAKNATTGVCTQGTAGVDGAFAKRINGTWRCD